MKNEESLAKKILASLTDKCSMFSDGRHIVSTFFYASQADYPRWGSSLHLWEIPQSQNIIFFFKCLQFLNKKELSTEFADIALQHFKGAL